VRRRRGRSRRQPTARHRAASHRPSVKPIATASAQPRRCRRARRAQVRLRAPPQRRPPAALHRRREPRVFSSRGEARARQIDVSSPGRARSHGKRCNEVPPSFSCRQLRRCDKHVTLLASTALKRKSGFLYLETHAGSGAYELAQRAPRRAHGARGLQRLRPPTPRRPNCARTSAAAEAAHTPQ